MDSNDHFRLLDPAVALDLSNLRILLVDDNEQVRLLVRQILKTFGIRQVVQCRDGADAIETLRHEPLDVIITDWLMKPVDGLEMTRILRTAEDSPAPAIPIILMSGHADRSMILKARDTGVTEILVKPITPQTLYNHLKAVVEKPRTFVQAPRYAGPDRRRRVAGFDGQGRRTAD